MEFKKEELKNVMLYTYIDKCGLAPSEIIEAITRYKALKKIGITSTVNKDEQLDLFPPQNQKPC